MKTVEEIAEELRAELVKNLKKQFEGRALTPTTIEAIKEQTLQVMKNLLPKRNIEITVEADPEEDGVYKIGIAEKIPMLTWTGILDENDHITKSI